MENTNKVEVLKTFGKNAQKYVDSETHSKGKSLSYIVEWLEPESHWRVLDIATGGGHVPKRLATHVKEVFATDLTKEMLHAASNHLKDFKNIQYVLADAQNLPFLDHYFDAVTCRIAPHHFPDPNHFIFEVSRVLKPGGKFLLIDNSAPPQKELGDFINHVEKERDRSHVRCLSEKEWTTLGKQHGLSLQNDLSAKKFLPFEDWVNRTVEDVQQKQRVEHLLLESTSEQKNYYEINIENNHVQSFQIDEWLAVFTKE